MIKHLVRDDLLAGDAEPGWAGAGEGWGTDGRVDGGHGTALARSPLQPRSLWSEKGYPPRNILQVPAPPSGDLGAGVPWAGTSHVAS